VTSKTPSTASEYDVESHLAILNLEGEYARTWDTANPEGWAGLFTEDGIFEMLPVGRTRGEFFRGHSELAAFCRRINESYRGLHLIHVPSVCIEGDRANSWIHFEFRSLQGSTQGSVAGIYQVDYARTSDGWRIHHRIEQAVARSSSAFGPIPTTLASLVPQAD